MTEIEIKGVLVNYTEDIVQEILQNCDFNNCKKKERKKIIWQYLRTKYNFKGCPSKGQKNYWIARGFNKETSDAIYKNYSSVYSTNSVQSICKRHSVSETKAIEIIKERAQRGLTTLNSRPDLKLINAKKGLTLKNCVEKHGESKGRRLYEKEIAKRKGRTNLNGFIRKHGESKGIDRFKQFQDKCAKTHSLNHYIEMHGKTLGLEKFKGVCKKKSKAQTLKGYIERYGKCKGTKLFTMRQERWQSSIINNNDMSLLNKSKGKTYAELISRHGEAKAKEIIKSKITPRSKASKESLKIFIPLYKGLRKLGFKRNDLLFGISGSKEYFISHNERFYLYDFTILSKRVIIEFNGTKFHPKAIKVDGWKQLYSGLTSKEVFEMDYQKKIAAEANAFKVLTVWSDQTNSNTYLELLEKII